MEKIVKLPKNILIDKNAENYSFLPLYAECFRARPPEQKSSPPSVRDGAAFYYN
ncbi:hypothetical protein AALA61_00745 [Oscillospiraceae bacterium 42-9]